MTNDKESTCDDSFQVVLIDIQKAAKGEIYCVKKPLTEELKYVAISYRWGELQERNINTRVGYVASITSFDLQDFYELCASMTKETDLKSIDYVWVDTICVNQSNYDERKATIYHMTEIYEQATWVLAVPDLHAAHLRAMTNHSQVMDSINQHRSYIYHLLCENTEELQKMDASFLDTSGVPQDPDLRLLLTKFTECFADGFTRTVNVYCYHEDIHALAHLFDIHQHSFTNDSDKDKQVHKSWQFGFNEDPERLPYEIRYLHQCHDSQDCPFKCAKYTYYPHKINGGWHTSIIERSKLIRQAMYFLKDLMVDWSSRVWVISEFHIAKKKNNLKFWFTQLNGNEATLTFFKFDMADRQFKKIQRARTRFSVSHLPTPGAVYLFFYEKLINQLNGQIFLEMMLKSKASKNEDRFYSIFPLFPEYRYLLQVKPDLVNNVSSILSVKLKLYQVMTNEDKKLLFYLSAAEKATYTLPTFATTMITWRHADYYNSQPFGCKQYIDKDVAIGLGYETTKDNDRLYFLNVKPWQYKFAQAELSTNTAAGRTLAQLLKRKTPSLKTGEHDTLTADLVRIAAPLKLYSDSWPVILYLIGSFNENTWILSNYEDFKQKGVFDFTKDLPINFYGFHIY